jgi:hypothetical protein
VARGMDPCSSSSNGREEHQQQQPPWRVGVSSPGEGPTHPRSPCTDQRLTGPHQPGYRERGTAVPPTPSAFPSSGDGSEHRHVASVGTAGREAAREIVPRNASPSPTRWARRVRRHLHGVLRWQAPRAWQYSCAQALVVIVAEEDSVSPDKSKTHYIHQFKYKK